MIGEFQNIKIQGIASAVPKYVEENSNYAPILGERRTKKQIKLTGVSKRHIAGTYQRTSDLCYASAVSLLDKLKWNREEIKVLIFITQGPNYPLPSTAFFLQKRLGLSKDCFVFDMNLGCSSFNAGVHVVSALLQSCNVSDKALLLIGDTASKVLQPDEKLDESVIANRMLFGAAGAAIALEKVENSNLKFMNKSDGNGFEAIIRHYNRGTAMDGTAVFEFAINDVSDDVKAFKKHFRMQEDEIDYYVFHQAQKLILDNIAAVCEFPDGKELRSVEEYGNTSGTSVPLTVCANRDKFADKESVKLYLCGFGVGLSWGSIYTEIPTENILPVIETDEHYDEDKKPANGLHDKCILVADSDLAMGEALSRYLNKRSAKVLLLGSDIDKLTEIQKDLFLESHIVSVDESENAYKKVSEYCKAHDITLDGIVFANPDGAREGMKEGLLFLHQEELMNNQASVVLMSDIETLKSENNEELYRKEKMELDCYIEQLQSEIHSDDIRINAVLYDNTKMELIQITGDGTAWIEEFLSKGCPADMKKVIYVGQAVTYLLSNQSMYTTGTMLSVNR